MFSREYKKPNDIDGDTVVTNRKRRNVLKSFAENMDDVQQCDQEKCNEVYAANKHTEAHQIQDERKRNRAREENLNEKD